jgi:hypothetical protein
VTHEVLRHLKCRFTHGSHHAATWCTDHRCQ